ncbi:hypothetical protein HQQ81_19550 [Microbacteriaceae bacterium VKM Ac-2854]|nr:hypothetical protein [Microbacteriaceae bacterium VKM Ac-2854]
MRPHRYSVLRYSYLAVSLFGWLLFGVFLRADLDLIAGGGFDLLAVAATALFGLILLVGTPIGYAVISAERPGRLRSSERQ